MSATSPRHHDTAAENASGPATVTAGTADGQPTTTEKSRNNLHVDTAAAAGPTTIPPYIHGDNAAGDAETLSYPPLSDPSQPLLPPANFAPFFALVEDATTAGHHHPSVHYVFSDDDPDLHTAVFLRALGDTAAASPTATRHNTGLQQPEHEAAAAANAAAGAGGGIDILPPPAPGVRERYVVVDLTPDGQGVAGATSLSRDWQVVGTAIAPAPSFGGEDDDAAAGDGGGGGVLGGGALMLRVEGTEIKSSNNIKAAATREEGEEAVLAVLGDARKGADGDLVGGMEEMLQRFDGGVDMLRKVVGPDVDVMVHQAAEAGEGPVATGDEAAT